MFLSLLNGAGELLQSSLTQELIVLFPTEDKSQMLVSFVQYERGSRNHSWAASVEVPQSSTSQVVSPSMMSHSQSAQPL